MEGAATDSEQCSRFGSIAVDLYKRLLQQPSIMVLYA
jgi:hypothetical protein